MDATSPSGRQAAATFSTLRNELRKLLAALQNDLQALPPPSTDDAGDELAREGSPKMDPMRDILRVLFQLNSHILDGEIKVIGIQRLHANTEIDNFLVEKMSTLEGLRIHNAASEQNLARTQNTGAGTGEVQAHATPDFVDSAQKDGDEKSPAENDHKESANRDDVEGESDLGGDSSLMNTLTVDRTAKFSTIGNYSRGGSVVQFSVVGKQSAHIKNVALSGNITQVGGTLSDATLRQLSKDFSGLHYNPGIASEPRTAFRIGEAIADENSDQVLVATGQFSAERVQSTNKSSQLVGSATERSLQDLIDQHYEA
jgi:hypothetical protein